MTKERRKKALDACEKFLIKSKWNFHTGLVVDLWLAAVEWADNNKSDKCSPVGFGCVHIGGFRNRITKRSE